MRNFNWQIFGSLEISGLSIKSAPTLLHCCSYWLYVLMLIELKQVLSQLQNLVELNFDGCDIILKLLKFIKDNICIVSLLVYHLGLTNVFQVESQVFTLDYP